MMKRIIFPILAMLFVLSACDYNEINFDGLDEKTVPTDIKSLEYTLTDADYTTISNNATNKALAVVDGVEAELSNLKTTRRFSETLPASKYIPAFIASMWKTGDNGSAIKVTFNQAENLPAYLGTLSSAQTYTVTAGDYISVWGSVPANYFTPAKPLSGHVSRLLSAAYPSAVNGDVKIVSYNYSSSEPSADVQLETSINEGFDGVAVDAKVNISGWSNIAETGSVNWVGKSFSGNFYAQCSAFGAASEVKSWLISPTISLSNVENPKFSFDVKIGYYNADCLSILISEDFNGVDPATANWVDVTSQFAFYHVASGYGPMYIAGLLDMSAFKEKPINIAFKYSGDGANNKTTTYQIDNVQVGGDVTVSATQVYTEPFTSDISTWGNVLVKGTKVWQSRVYSGDYYAQYSANGTTEEQEGWLVSPDISIAAGDVAQLLFDVTIGYYNATCLSVLVSDNYTDDINTATWEDITSHFYLPTTPASGYGQEVHAGSAPLNKYAGKTINVAFKYVGNGADNRTTTYQIDNVEVRTLAITTPSPSFSLKSSSAGVNELLAIYTFNGTSWVPFNNASILNPSDYAAMGIPYFSANAKPENYLPGYLTLKFPYAQESKTVGVVYNFGSNSTYLADEYSFIGGSWVKNNAIEIVTDQFVRANGVWVWDPSVVINLVPVRNDAFVMSYYQTATDWVWENIDKAQLGVTTKGQGYVTSFGNNEYYTGCSAYYNNVDMRPSAAKSQYSAGYTGMSDNDIIALMKERLAVVMGKVLEIKHPDAKAIEGVNVTYTVNVGIFTGTTITGVNHSIVYKVVGNGQFEHVSGPTLIQ